MKTKTANVNTNTKKYGARRPLCILLTLCIMICFMPHTMVANAATKGWTQEDGEWVWLDSNGEKATETFKLSGSNYYWLNEDGFLGSNELVEYKGDYYYVDDTGAMVKSQWVDVENNSNDDTFKDSKYLRYYFQSSGKAYKSGKKDINGNTYVFDSQGRMLYGWINYSNGVWSMASKDANNEEWKNCIYYASDDGALVKGNWQQIRVYDGSTFCDYQFYFKANGKKAMMDEEDAAKGYSLIQVDKKVETEYAFAVDGHRMPEFESETSSESTSKKGWSWNAETEKNYYLGDDGTPLYKKEIQSINGKKYLFDSDGVMLTGLYYLKFTDDEKSIETITPLDGEDDVNNFTAYTTLNENTYNASESTSKSGVYYFKGPASTAGEMVTGSTTVEVDGDKYSFKFATSDNKGKGLNGTSDSYYYVNGRRVKADSDQKYELFECVIDDSGKVTKLTSGSNTASKIVTDASNTQDKTYALINSTGTIVKSGTKTDSEGYKIKVADYKVTEIKDENKNVVWPSSGLSTPTATLKVSASASQGDSTTAQDAGSSSDGTATFKYGTDATTIKPSVVFSGGEDISASSVTYKYGTDMNSAIAWPTEKTPLNVGTYYAWAIIAPTNDYAGTTIATSFNVTGTDISANDVTAENVTKTYTGSEQEIKVTIDTSKITDMTGKKVTYSLTSDGVYSDSLTFTDATDGAQTVYYRITSDNYNAYIGTATVTVNPIVANLTWSNDASINCTESENIVATVENAKEGDDFNITYDRTIDSAGNLTVKVKSLGNSNYVLPTDETNCKKVVSVTHTGTEKYEKVNDTTHHKVYSCCNRETETAKDHTFDQQVVDTKYLKSAATCTSAVVYYKSCVCGAFSNAANAETFTSGTTLAHTYDQEVANSTYLKTAATCKAPAVYYKSCVCGAFSNADGATTFESGSVNANNHTGTLGDWQYDSTQHWKVYSCCGAKANIANHTDTNSDNKCDTCGKTLSSSSGGSSGGSSGSAVVTPTKPDNVTNKTETTATGTEKVTNAEVSSKTTTKADGSKTTTTTVDTKTADKIVEKAVENKSETVVIDAASSTGSTGSSSSSASGSAAASGKDTSTGSDPGAAAPVAAEVAIPAVTVTQLSEKTDAAVTIKTDIAEVTLDQKAVAAIAEAVKEDKSTDTGSTDSSSTEKPSTSTETPAATGEVKIIVTTTANTNSAVKLDVKIETSNGEVKNLKGGSVSVTVKLNTTLAAKKLVCVYIDDKGIYHKVKGQKNANQTYTFKTL